MRQAEFRFYEELNDFLPPERRKRAFLQPFYGRPAVRDVIQAIGVPHAEVDLVLVDGLSVGFDHRLDGGERVAVYPVFERLDVAPLQRLRHRPLRRVRFIADVHLGKLARLLRMLGFDTVYEPDLDDPAIIDRALVERRVILTRDVGLLKHSRVTHGHWLRSTEPERQAAEVLRALQLAPRVRPFRRCRECNGRIEEADPGQLAGRLAPAILNRFDHFWRCAGCGRVYWKASHYAAMREQLRRILEAAGSVAP